MRPYTSLDQRRRNRTEQQRKSFERELKPPAIIGGQDGLIMLSKEKKP